jgi:Domain of unknown function (DUF4424)
MSGRIGTAIKIQHRYKPSVGLGAGTVVSSNSGREAIRRYCLDEQFLGAVERAKKQMHTEYAPFRESRIAYILSTGAGWRAPIGDFRLVVDKGRPDNLISFCRQTCTKLDLRDSRCIRPTIDPSRISTS